MPSKYRPPRLWPCGEVNRRPENCQGNSGAGVYTNDAKVEMLGVKPATLKAFGAVSEEIAREMAAGALDRSHANIAVSVTGIAGPGASEHKPEGRVCFGLAQIGQETLSVTIEFGALGRAQVRQATVDFALDLVLQHID